MPLIKCQTCAKSFNSALKKFEHCPLCDGLAGDATYDETQLETPQNPSFPEAAAVGLAGSAAQVNVAVMRFIDRNGKDLWPRYFGD